MCKLYLFKESLCYYYDKSLFFQASSRRTLNTAQILLVASHPDVYEPCDDSFALIDALLSDKAHILTLQPEST
jgi:hypothetical protein